VDSDYSHPLQLPHQFRSLTVDTANNQSACPRHLPGSHFWPASQICGRKGDYASAREYKPVSCLQYGLGCPKASSTDGPLVFRLGPILLVLPVFSQMSPTPRRGGPIERRSFSPGDWKTKFKTQVAPKEVQQVCIPTKDVLRDDIIFSLLSFIFESCDYDSLSSTSTIPSQNLICVMRLSIVLNGRHCASQFTSTLDFLHPSV
jgi:hypothetical protein